jgi:peptide chain release factor subunit 1
MSDAQANEAEKNIEIWKVKKLIKRLEAARGNGTSMISLIIRECLSGAHAGMLSDTNPQRQRTRSLVRQKCWQKNTYGNLLFAP